MRRLMLMVLIFAVLGLPRPMLAAEQCFAHDKTPYCLKDQFNDYWNTNGGLAVFGYPLSQVLNEWNADAQALFPTQWLERNRFEYHAENAGTPYAVLLGLLGKEALAQQGRDWAAEAREAGPQAGCLWFEQTGHNVCNQSGSLGFKAYWESHGLQVAGLDAYARSLQLFGLPLTAPTMETNSSGDTVLTQWFERARFEWHPDNPNAFKVLLGLLGKEVTGGHAALTGEIIYVVNYWDPGLGCCQNVLKSVQADGSQRHTVALPDGIVARSLHSAAADGSYLVFNPQSAALDQQLMRRDGSELRALNTGTSLGSMGSLAWAPDGQRLAVAGTQQGNSAVAQIVVVTADGRVERTLSATSPEFIGIPAWSADGQRLAYVKNAAELWESGPAGERLIATRAFNALLINPLLWVRGDTTLLVNFDQPSKNIHSALYAVDVATGATQPFLTTPGAKACFRLSPDREWLAFMDGVDNPDAPARLTVLRVDGSEQRTLPGALVDWSPDSQYLLSMEGNAELWAVSLDGARRIQVAATEPGYQPNATPCTSPYSAETSALWLPN